VFITNDVATHCRGGSPIGLPGHTQAESLLSVGMARDVRFPRREPATCGDARVQGCVRCVMSTGAIWTPAGASITLRGGSETAREASDMVRPRTLGMPQSCGVAVQGSARGLPDRSVAAPA
jgi:hypothetical protein